MAVPGAFTNFFGSLFSKIKVKRQIKLDKLVAVTLSRFGHEFVLHIPEEYDYRYSSHDKYALHCNSSYFFNRRALILDVLTCAYLAYTKKPFLPFFFKDDLTLEHYATYQDVKKKRNLPNAY